MLNSGASVLLIELLGLLAVVVPKVCGADGCSLDPRGYNCLFSGS